MAKIKTIDTRVVKAFENSSREDIVKHLEWLRATIEVLSQNIRRTIGLALVLIAAFGLVNTSSNTVITVGSFKLSGGSIVAIFIPAIVQIGWSARTRDIDDLRLLADIIGVNSAEAALRITADFYPDEPVSPGSAAVLHELFD